MNRPVMPPSLAPPAAHYAHAVLSEGPQRLLHTSGVVPVARDESTPSAVEAQASLVWDHLAALLADAGMTVADIVSVTTYVVAGQELGGVMAARDLALGGHLAASTLVTVPALARPEWLVEIAIVAARS